jgi:hypothetical protein
MLNSKFEALSAYVKTTADKNPKQTCLTTVKIQNSFLVTGCAFVLKIWILDIQYCFEFRISCFDF